jgi:hypothetical protein
MAQNGLTLEARAEAVRRVQRKFEGRPFDWTEGATCLHLVRAQARAMGHHGLPRIPKLSGPNDALRALRAQGVVSLAGLLDRHFERLQAPAFALVGDMLLLPGEDGATEPMGALVIADGVGSVLGWHDSGLLFGPIKATEGFAVVGWRL